MNLRLNGCKLVDSDQAGNYVELARTRRDGDVLDIDLPMHVYLPSVPNAAHRVALMYGPLVLAARVDSAAMPLGNDFVGPNMFFGKKLTEPLEILPLRLDGVGLNGVVRRGVGGLVFHLNGQRAGGEYELLPFHNIAHGYYNLYGGRIGCVLEAVPALLRTKPNLAEENHFTDAYFKECQRDNAAGLHDSAVLVLCCLVLNGQLMGEVPFERHYGMMPCTWKVLNGREFGAKHSQLTNCKNVIGVGQLVILFHGYVHSVSR